MHCEHIWFRKWLFTQVFSKIARSVHFLTHILAIFDDFSRFHSTFGAIHFEKLSNMAKKLIT